MKTRRVHHFTATMSIRDAVSHHTFAVDDLLREMGVETALFAQSIHPDLKGRVLDFRDHADHDRPDLLIYQASTGSAVADYLLDCPEPLVLDYHNITPAEMFDPWDSFRAAELSYGRRQLGRLAKLAIRGLADSRFNADELVTLGLTDVRVVPVIFDPPATCERDNTILGDPPTVLFVGRLAPNKCHEALIAAIAVLRDRIPNARLIIIGEASSKRYETALHELADRICPGGVEFAGSVTESAISDWYRLADVFLCLSEHEGFCVPLIEAMAAGVPVVALRATVVPETVGDAALLLYSKASGDVAGALERVFSDVRLRVALGEAGHERSEAFGPSVSRHIMRRELADLLESVL